MIFGKSQLGVCLALAAATACHRPDEQLPIPPVSPAAIISAAEAKDHIGETLTVSGEVVQVKTTRNRRMTFLNMGGTYPNQTCTIVSFRGDRTALKNYRGRTISVHGTIQVYRGKPQIVIESDDQISE